MKDNFRVFVLGHKPEQFYNFPYKPSLHPLDLNTLRLPIPNTNHIAEHRFFLQDRSYFENCPEYIGTLTVTAETKFPHMVTFEDIEFIEPVLSPDVVYAPRLTNSCTPQWIEFSICMHGPNFAQYMRALSEAMNTPLLNSPTFWANNFICHKNVFLDFVDRFQDAFFRVHSRYGYDMRFECEDPCRLPAYLYERAAMMYFGSRRDLTIKCMPTIFDQFYVLAASSDNYRPLTDVWYDSILKAGFQPHNINHYDFELPSGFNRNVQFETSEYSYCLLKKLMLVLQGLKDFRDKRLHHRYILVSDCDIRFFTERTESWQALGRWLKFQDADIFYPHEWDNEKGVSVMNGGFFVAKASSINHVIAFYERLCNEVSQAMSQYDNKALWQLMPHMDQTLINYGQSSLKKCMIPKRWHIQGRDYRPEHKDSVLFHHAIDTKNMQEKIQQMNQINAYVQG